MLLNRYICDRISDTNLPRNLKELPNGVLYFSRSLLKCPDFRIYSSFTKIYVNSPYLKCDCMKKLNTQRIIGCLPSSVSDFRFASSTVTSVISEIPKGENKSPTASSSPVFEQTKTLNPAPSEIPVEKTSKSNTWKWIVILIALFTMSGGICCTALCYWIRSGVPRAQIENVIGADRNQSIEGNNNNPEISWSQESMQSMSQPESDVCMMQSSLGHPIFSSTQHDSQITLDPAMHDSSHEGSNLNQCSESYEGVPLSMHDSSDGASNLNDSSEQLCNDSLADPILSSTRHDSQITLDPAMHDSSHEGSNLNQCSESYEGMPPLEGPHGSLNSSFYNDMPELEGPNTVNMEPNSYEL